MINIMVNNELIIKGKLPEEAEAYLKKRLTFTNPEYVLAERQHRSTYNISPTLSFFKKKKNKIFVPRGFSAQALGILRMHEVKYNVAEETRLLPEIDVNFCRELYTFQQKAVESIVARRFGVLNSPTGSGKTVMALAVIAARKQPALVICHTKELLYQWRDRAVEFLGMKESEIGLVGDGNRVIGKPLTIAIVNSLYKCVDELADKIGHLIVDECHRVPSRTFTEAIKHFDSRYMLGLSATAYRRDKLTKVIYFYMGDSVYSISPQELQKHNKIMVASLVVRETNFYSEINGSSEYQALLQELVNNRARNELIVDDVIEEAQQRRGICLVLSDRKNHCETLHEILVSKSGMSVELLTGDTKSSVRKKIVRDLDEQRIDILVASGRLVGEGFDCKSLSSLFLATPVKFSGRVIQYLGRILRTCEGKVQPKIFDYIDELGVLRSSFKSRLSAYKTMGVELGNALEIEL
ncbi:DEAD/DEAH box helicase [Candidatus Uabimicrobium sp. HlEnr_7]|uniref:DEAD/DEAH box helicase n=1 Tax=Candidatus Uabimicrobium helgolandensis TaxID=3095367 RepID=UPI0035564F70